MRVRVAELRTKPIVKAPRVVPMTTSVATTAVTTMPGKRDSKEKDSAPRMKPSTREKAMTSAGRIVLEN